MADHDIVFEDLRGGPEDKPVQVDLDAGTKDDGITALPDGQSASDDDKKDDDIKFDSLRSVDDDTPTKKADDDDASKPSEDDTYSKKVKARIQRATRATKKEKDRGDFWEQQARKIAKDSYDGEKRSAESIIERADSEITATEASLKTAIEDGKTDDQVSLTSKLTDLKASKVKAEYALDNLSPDGNVQPFSGNVRSTTDKDDANKADSWMSEHDDWYGARGFERQTRLANRLDKEVHADGYDPETDEYFEELNRRIKEKEPKLFDDGDAAGNDDDTELEGDKSRGKPKTPVAPVGGAEGSRRRTSGNKVELGEDDFANMRRFNLDPNDPEVLKEYARNKREAETQGAN